MSNNLLPHPDEQLQQVERYAPELQGGHIVVDILDNLEHAGSLSQQPLDPSQPPDEHIMLMGLLHGWDTIEHYAEKDEQWKDISAIDTALYSSSSGLEDLGERILSMQARRYWKFKVSGAQALRQTHLYPEWMHPTTLQQQFSHSPTADVIAWPGVRNRLILSPHRYFNEEFWSYWFNCYRINWPFDPREIFISVQVLDQTWYQLSPQFRWRWNDLGSWTMRDPFFERYPEFLGDVKRLDPQPQRSMTRPFTELFARGLQEILDQHSTEEKREERRRANSGRHQPNPQMKSYQVDRMARGLLPPRAVSSYLRALQEVRRANEGNSRQLITKGYLEALEKLRHTSR